MNMQSVTDVQPNGAEPLTPEQMIEKSRELIASGAVAESLPVLLDAFAADPECRITQSLLIEVLAATTGYNLPNGVYNALAESALGNNHDMAALSTIICRQFEADPAVRTAVDFFEAFEAGTDPADIQESIPVAELQHVLGNQLFMLVATKGIAHSPMLERLTKALRRTFLLEWCGTASTTSLLIDSCPEMLTAVAGQCFNTEYIYAETAEETAFVHELYNSVQEDPISADVMDFIILAAYKPLWAALAGNKPQELEKLIKRAETWPAWAQIVWKAQFLAPCQEMYLKENMPTYTKISKGASTQLQRQYDAYPFPRWQTGTRARVQRTLKEHLSQQFPQAELSPLEDGPVNMLFAGCGTGEEIITFASAYKTENILALDLSLPSLAHAQRRAHELGVTNAHFGHGDILEFSTLDVQFPVIVCQRVLDHMLHLDQSMEALKTVAKPGALLALNLYSERARRHVKAAHNLIAANNLKPTYDGLRAFRELARSLADDHPAKKITESRQFYTASELHDLAFNTEEHCFIPAELNIFLKEQGLKFIGFEFDSAVPKQLYQQCFPEDVSMTNLNLWERLDHEYPQLFENGMRFWCQLA